MLSLLVLLSLAASPALAEPFDYSLSREVLDQAKIHARGTSAQTDLSNIRMLPNLEIGATLEFETVMTLREFQCESLASEFTCRVVVHYCYPRNEYFPALNTLTIQGKLRPLRVEAVARDSVDGSLSACPRLGSE